MDRRTVLQAGFAAAAGTAAVASSSRAQRQAERGKQALCSFTDHGTVHGAGLGRARAESGRTHIARH